MWLSYASQPLQNLFLHYLALIFRATTQDQLLDNWGQPYFPEPTKIIEVSSP